MSAATPNKKPMTPMNGSNNPRREANGRSPANTTTTTTANTTPSAGNRSPSRMAPQASAAAANAPNGINRMRSVRNGARVSARAAAASRKQPDGDASIEDIKAEMQAKLDELQERLQQAELAHEESQKQVAVLQSRLDEAHKDQAMLEESVHEQTERIEELENEKRESLRARREMEQIYEAERVAVMKEKEEAAAREEEMQTAMQRLKEALAQREMRAGLEDGGKPSISRNSSFSRRSHDNLPAADSAGHFAPPSSLQRSDSRSSSKLVMAKDKIIESLRLELAEAQIKLVEVENMGGGQLQALQKELYEIKMQNARLMEENESFQLLLSEKTLNGDFAASDLLRPSLTTESRPPSRRAGGSNNVSGATGTTLADELADHNVDDSLAETDTSTLTDDQTRKLQNELSSLKDQNKALTLYINNIISRLLQHEQFEQILDKTPDLMAGPNAAVRDPAGAANTARDKELPPPPPPKKDEEAVQEQQSEQEPPQPQGFLQRARSVMGGRGRPRPMTQAVSAEDRDKLSGQLQKAENETLAKAIENPETAPRVPLGRSNSTRASGHRRANSEWPAASLVTNMYKGPPTGIQGPVSPGLGSPTAGVRGSFFPLGARVTSSGSVPTISESAMGDKENAAPGGSSGSTSIKPPLTHSNRNSVISNTGLDVIDDTAGPGAEGRSTPSSPPRSTTSSGEREKGTGGAIMMGSKPRPLRLVQAAAEADHQADEAARKAANRGSWFGWMNAGTAAKPPTQGVLTPGQMGRSVSGSSVEG